MKIVFIAVKGIPYGGGIEKVTEEIGKRLVKRGHEVVVYCSKIYCKDNNDYAGMKLRILPSLKTQNLQKFSLCFNATLHMLVKENADVVHFHSIGAFFSGFTKARHIKSVAHIHSFEWKKEKWNNLVKFFLNLSDNIANHFADQVIVVSHILKKYYDNKFAKNTIFLPNGVETANYIASDLIKAYDLSKGSYILYMGRLSSEKGVHYLVDAYKNIKTDKKLVLAGDFSYNSKYNNFLKQKCYQNKNIVLPGYVTGKKQAELFSNAYLSVFPSEIEGSPIALLEAMSYGNCCVASDIPENLEILNSFGYIFKNRDVDNLQRTLRLLLNNKDLVDKNKSRVKKYVLENFNWESITDRLENLYSSLLERN